MSVRQTISLCMIVRNEEENLRACLEPMAGLVDEIVIVDTGSTDGTKAVAADLGAKVYDFEWVDDFSAARNESRRHATGQWIFWLDADDRITGPNRDKLAMLFSRLTEEEAQKNTGYMMPCVSRIGSPDGRALTVSHLRLFPSASGFTWRGRVHEHPQPGDPGEKILVRWSDVVIEHVGYVDSLQRRRKRNRDLRLLQIDYATNPNDSVALFYLGWARLEFGALEEGLKLLRRGIRREPDLRCARVRKAYALIADALTELGRNNEALEACDAGLALYPNDSELLYERAILLGKLGKLAEAEACYLRLVTTPADAYLQYSVEEGLRTFKSRYMLGVIYRETGRLPEAEAQFQIVLAEKPGYLDAWMMLGQLYLTQGRQPQTETVIQRMAACPGGEILAQSLRAQLLIAQRRSEDARLLLEEIISRQPSVPWPRMVLADLLFALDTHRQRCIALYQELAQWNPHVPVVRQRLEKLLRLPDKPVAAAPQRQPVAAPEGAFVLAGQ